jgi:recombination protein RecA
MEHVKSGFTALDKVLGGGYPQGRIVEMFGPESSGKTTLALHAIAQVQAARGIAALVDVEHTFDENYAASVSMKMNTDKLLVSQPDTAEQALEIVEMLTRTGIIDLVVVFCALPPPNTEEELALQTRLMSQALRKLTVAAHRFGSTIVFVQKTATGIRGTSPGGNALKFYASVRLEVKRSGSRVTVRTVKNKMAPPFQAATFELTAPDEDPIQPGAYADRTEAWEE